VNGSRMLRKTMGKTGTAAEPVCGPVCGRVVCLAVRWAGNDQVVRTMRERDR